MLIKKKEAILPQNQAIVREHQLIGIPYNVIALENEESQLEDNQIIENQLEDNQLEDN